MNKQLQHIIGWVALFVISIWTVYAATLPTPEEQLQNQINTWIWEQEDLHYRNTTLSWSLIPNAEKELEEAKLAKQIADNNHIKASLNLNELEREYFMNSEDWKTKNHYIEENEVVLTPINERKKNIWNLKK